MSVVKRVLKSGKVVYYAVVRQNGKQIYQHCGSSSRLAKDLNAERVAAAKNNALPTMRDIRFSQLVERYFEDGCHNLRSQTISSYEARLKNHLLPFFSELKVRRSLTTSTILSWQTYERRRGVSDKSIKSALVTLSAVLSYAVTINLIASSPCHRVKAPKVVDGGVEYTLTPAEVALVVRNTPDKNGDRTLLLYMAMVGCRPSEAVEARFSDVDWHNHTVTISRTAVRKSTTNPTGTNPTKTGKTRVVPLSASLLLALSGEKRRLKATGDDLIFPTVTGKRRQPQRFASEVFRPALTRSGLRVPDGSRSLLCLRKSCASNLLQQGESPKMVSELLGQSPHVLLKHYTKIRSEDATAAIDRLAATMAGDSRDTTGKVVQIA